MQLSTDIKVMVTIVIGTKKTKLHELEQIALDYPVTISNL